MVHGDTSHRKFTGDPGLAPLSPPLRRNHGLILLDARLEGGQDNGDSSETDNSETDQKTRHEEKAFLKEQSKEKKNNDSHDEVALSPTKVLALPLHKESGNQIDTNIQITEEDHLQPLEDMELGNNETSDIQPGAVAVNGIGGIGRSNHYDSLVSNSDRARGSEQRPREANFTAGALEVVVPEAVLVEENRSYRTNMVEDENLSQHRWRMTLFVVVVLVVAAAVTTGVVVGTRSRSGSDSSVDPGLNETAFCGDGIVGNGTCLGGLCCSEFGFCGVTPEFCINGQEPPENITEVFCGDGIVGNGTCPGGLCCSEFGFCGSTAQFCKGGEEIPGKDQFCGDGIIGNGTCDGGLCCSEFGFCGVTPEFCVNGQIPP